MLEELEPLLVRSQKYIDRVPIVYTHRDLNPRNCRELSPNTVAMLDFDTMGPAHIGFDEGRFLTYFTLDPASQQSIVGWYENRYRGEIATQIYFWRTVGIRCIRELNMLNNLGTYEADLGKLYTNEPEKQEALRNRLTNEFTQLHNMTVHKLKLLMGEES